MTNSRPAPPERTRWWPRFSLWTLILFTLLLGGGLGLWLRWEPWLLQSRLVGPKPIVYAEMSPDGRKVIAVCQQLPIIVFDSVTGREEVRLRKVIPDMASCGFVRGKDIFFSLGQTTIQLWNTSSGDRIACFRVTALAPSDPECAERIPIFEEIDYGVPSDDGDILLLIFRSGCAGIWDAATGEHIRWLANREMFNRVKVSSGDTGRRTIVVQRADASIAAFELARDLRPLGSLGPLIAPCLELAVSPDGRKVLVAEEDRNMFVWDWLTNEKHKMDGVLTRRFDVEFSPDGSRLLADDDLYVFRLWDTSSGKLIAAPDAERNYWERCRFLPGGKRVMSIMNTDCTRMRLWSASTGDFAGEVEPEPNYGGYAFRVLSGDRLGVSGYGGFGISPDERVRIHDAADGALMTVVGGEAFCARLVGVSADGNRLLSSTEDGQLQVWNRQRPESRYGFMVLPEFWVAATVVPLLFWSLYLDCRTLAWFPAQEVKRTEMPRWKRRLLEIRARFTHAKRCRRVGSQQTNRCRNRRRSVPLRLNCR